jgi:hypothetical protein
VAEILRRAHAAEADIDRWLAAVEERLHVAGQRTLVWQDPRAALKDGIRGVGPGRQRGVRREPRPIGEDMAAYITDRGQAT